MRTPRLRNIDIKPIKLCDDLTEIKESVAYRIVDSLVETGIVVVQSPFGVVGDTTVYTEMLSRYFARSPEVLQRDERPEVFRQVGITLPGGEDFSESQHFRTQLGCRQLTGDRAPYPCDGPNRHMRFFWRVGARRPNPKFAESHADPVIPDGFPEWETTLNVWGDKMIRTGTLLMHHIEQGLRVAQGLLVDMLQCGPNLVAPTGVDLRNLPVGTVTSDVHTDFNPLTLHGAAPFPTLICWTKVGMPFLVRVPPGCVLIQAGVGLERMTGGAIKAGYHQTVVLPETAAAVARAVAEGRSTIRPSGTVFLHFDWEAQLRVLPELRYPGCDELYPPMLVGDHALDVIGAIGLKRPRLD